MKFSTIAVLVLSAVTMSNANATVDHTHGQIVGHAADGTYSVLQDGSIWTGVSSNELTHAQLDAFNSGNINNPVASPLLTAANKQRTIDQAVALADAQQEAKDRADKQIANMGTKNDPTGVPMNSPADGAALTTANQHRANDQAVALADAQQAAKDRAEKQGAERVQANQQRTSSQVTALNDAQGAALAEANQQRTASQVTARNDAQGAALAEANQQRTASQVTALNDAQGAALAEANQQRTASQVTALNDAQGAALAEANQQRTASQVTALNDAQGAALAEANQQRTASQVTALNDAQGAALAEANQQRTASQVTALNDAQGAALAEANQQRTASQVTALNDAQGAALAEANQQRTASQVTALTTAETAAQVANPTPHLDTPDVNAERAAAMKQAILEHREVIAHQARFAGMDNQPMATINVAATSLNPDTPVSVTVNGTEQATTAGTVAQFDPQVQISIPMPSSYFQKTLVRNGQNHDQRSTSNHGGTGNGSNNAANSASAHGLGGGSHIGGGSAQNGGFHGNW